MACAALMAPGCQSVGMLTAGWDREWATRILTTCGDVDLGALFDDVDKRYACAKLGSEDRMELTMTSRPKPRSSVIEQEVLLDANELQALVRARSDASTQTANHEVAHVLADEAAKLRSHTRWTPSATQVQRGEALLMDAFNRSTNLPPPRFAGLAGKSAQEVYEDIDARLLLAINVGARGHRLPDWQLDSVKRQLTERVLSVAGDVDDWTIYRALSEPLEGLGGRAAVEAVTADSIEATAVAVISALGLQTQHGTK